MAPDRIMFYACLLFMMFALPSCMGGGSAGYINTMMQSEDFNKTVQVGALEYDFKIRTPRFIALKDAFVEDESALNPEVFKQRSDDLKGHVILFIEQKVNTGNVSPLKYRIENQQQYTSRLMYYQFDASADICLVCGEDTIKPASYAFENNMDISTYNRMVAIFPACSKDISEMKFQFHDRALHNYFIKSTFNNKKYHNALK